MPVFSSAPLYKPRAPAKKKAAWNLYAERAKNRNERRALVEENLRLRLENERLRLVAGRLQRENDALWQEIGENRGVGGEIRADT